MASPSADPFGGAALEHFPILLKRLGCLPNKEVLLKAYQEDLRKRIIAAKESGQSGALVARRYNVTVRTVERYWKRYVETDSVQPKRLGGYRTSKLAAHDAALLRWIREKPDLTLVELQRRCAEELQVEVSVNALGTAWKS